MRSQRCTAAQARRACLHAINRLPACACASCCRRWPRSYQLPAEQKALLLKMFDRSFDACSAALVESHKALLALDRDNARAYATK